MLARMNNYFLTVAALALMLAACSPKATETPVAQTPAAAADTPATDADIARAEAERAAALEKEIAALKARGITPVGWEELMPEGEEERLAEMYQARMSSLYSIAEGSAGDSMVQIGTFNVVPELNGKKVRIPGYTVPFEFGENAKITEFLLVPYYGACLHSPPPPPNQTIFVKTSEPILITDLAQAVWIEGTLLTATQESDLADAAYTIEMSALEKYEY